MINANLTASIKSNNKTKLEVYFEPFSHVFMYELCPVMIVVKTMSFCILEDVVIDFDIFAHTSFSSVIHDHREFSKPFRLRKNWSILL